MLTVCRKVLGAITFGRVAGCFSFLSLLGLSYVGGAAVMHFDLPSADYLSKSFGGGKAWVEHTFSAPTPTDPSGGPAIRVYNAEKAYNGLTLYTTTQSSSAKLIDMKNGTLVHEWHMPFSQAWPKPPHVNDPRPDSEIHWVGCYLYPNGELLAVYHAFNDTPYGYGLIKLDKDSKLLWTYSANVHHDVDVDIAGDGRIYTLTQEIVTDKPGGLPNVPTPYLADYLVILSPEGHEEEKIPILEAFRDSLYSLTLATINKPKLKATIHPGYVDLASKGDILHTNSVKVLPHSLASHFPLFHEGQVLISVRGLDSIAMVDVKQRKVTWSANGIWRGQHDAEFLENGHLLVFDNLGSNQGARVLEYDPNRLGFSWFSVSDRLPPFTAPMRGMGQRLPNGNTLIVSPEDGRLIEVTQDKEIVWECNVLRSAGPPSSLVSINFAHRYSADALPFLKTAKPSQP